MLFKLRSMVMLVAIMLMIVGCGGGDDPIITPADYAGTYKGTFSGDDSGTWEVTVNTDGKLIGTLISSQVGTHSLSGTVSSTGKLDAVIGESSTGSTFSGTIDSEGNVNGTWSNPGQNQSGTFTGTKTGGDTPGTLPIGNLMGTWSVTDKVDARACDEGIYIDHYTIDVIVQSGNSITFTAKTGTYTGTLNGNKLTGSGSYPEDGGTTQTSVSLTVASDCNSMTGTSTWTWSDGTETCSGTSEVSAIRDNPVGCGTGTGGPNAPSGLTATATSESSIGLTWSDNADDEDNYVVQRSATSGSGFTTIATLGENNTSYYDHAGLTASTTYYYRVYTTNSVGNSSYSNEASATTADPATGAPIAPSGLSARATSSATIYLSWTDASSNESGFRIERSTSSTTGFTIVANVAANVTSYTDSLGLSALTTYYYRVVATNSGGDSAFSNTANATTLALNATPEAPTDLSAMATSTSSISLSWIDASNNETAFKIERSVILANHFVQIGTVAAEVTNYVDNSLAAATTYHYRVAAFNSVGSSAYSNTAHATTDGATTSAPVLTLISNVSGDITLQWIYGGWPTLGSNIEGYQLEESTTSASSGFSDIFNTLYSGDRVSPKTHSIPPRPAGTYYYRVRALKSVAGQNVFSDYSNVLAVTVTSDPTTLTITNNFNTENGRNNILQLRFANTELEARYDSNELLSPDNYFKDLPGKQIGEGESQTYDISGYGSNIYVFIGIGWWSPSLYFGYWEKKMYGIDQNFKQWWLWQNINIRNWDAGDALELNFSGGDGRIDLYQNGSYITTPGYMFLTDYDATIP